MKDKEKLICHHVKYLELDGVDEFVWVTPKEHILLHRQTGRVVPIEISEKAKSRSPRAKEYDRKRRRIWFYTRLELNAALRETIEYMPSTGDVFYNWAVQHK